MNINPNILPYSMLVDKISNGKLLVKGVNNIEDVWNEIVNTYILIILNYLTNLKVLIY